MLKGIIPGWQAVILAVCLLAAVLITGRAEPAGDEGGFPEPAIPFSPRRYACPFSPMPVRIDGRENDGAWQAAAWSEPFVDIEGPARPKPLWETRVKMAWDKSCFYILARLQEPDTWATLRQRDAVIFQDNDFEVFIDPDGDSHNYYELEINALGTVWDLFLDKPYRDGGRPLNSWDIRGLRSAVRVQGTLNRPGGDRDRAWWVEMAIPWEVLKECAPGKKRPEPGDIWRVNFSRVEWRVQVNKGNYQKAADPRTGKPYPEDNWVWSPQGLINMHYPEMWGYVFFSDQGQGGPAGDLVLPAEENAKWFLRRIYYRQHRHFAACGGYSCSLAALGLDDPGIAGFSPAVLHVTPGLFEASLTAVDGKARWSINQDGLIWKTEPALRGQGKRTGSR